MPRLLFRTEIEEEPEELYRWHMAAGALQRLSPPWESIRSSQEPLGEGVVRVLEIGPLRQRWLALHQDFVEGRQFLDLQQKGPFRLWEHTHRFLPLARSRSYLEDDIQYRLPLDWLSQPLVGGLLERQLARMFAFRHRTTRLDLARQRRFRDQGPQRIAISGASGLIGSQLAAFLSTAGHRVRRLARRPGEDRAALEGLDAVVHLAGKSVAEGRWSAHTRRAILESRSLATHGLCCSLAALSQPPRTLVCASAVGYYGDQGERQLDEADPPGPGFLAQVCQAWEAATRPAQQAGIRVVNLRIGVVLSARGGALPRLLLPFRWGMGVVPGGDQWVSWISHQDIVGAVHHCLFCPQLEGPVNAVSPHPVPMEELARTLGRVLRRPVWGRLPRSAFGLVLGEKAQVVTGSQRALPRRLEASGFEFADPRLELALRHELGV